MNFQTPDPFLLLQNSSYREEVLELSSRNLQLSSENGELSSRLHGEQESVRMLQERLATVTKKQEEEGAAVSQTGSVWTEFRTRNVGADGWMVSGAAAAGGEGEAAGGADLLQGEGKDPSVGPFLQPLVLFTDLLAAPQLGSQSQQEAELTGLMMKLQKVEQEKQELQRETENRNQQVRTKPSGPNGSPCRS